MAEDDEMELSESEVLTFGPVVESVIHHPMWLQESRAPIAVAAGRPKLGPIFNSEGVGKAVIIRPCISRGKRIRGLSPIYTPKMLEGAASVFNGWPMFLDHVPPELAEAMAKRGRSVKELGGQILTGHWSKDFVHEADAEYGYQKGAVLAEMWATPFIRQTVGENANLLHTSINAWPKSGKPGPVPWKPAAKGMVIEGIRRVPQGSVDFVVRGGAGGRLLAQEGFEDEGAWPETGEWSREDVQLVVSAAESVYAPRQMPAKPITEMTPAELREHLQAERPDLLKALSESAEPGKETPTPSATPLTEADVQRMLSEATESQPTAEEFEERLSELADEKLAEREEQRGLATIAERLIENAEGIPASWKTDLKARYAMLPSGPSQALIVEADTDAEGNERTVEQVLTETVKADLDHSRKLIADAQGKPRVTGEGAKKNDGEPAVKEADSNPFWAERMVSLGLAESVEDARAIYGVSKPEKEDK